MYYYRVPTNTTAVLPEESSYTLLGKIREPTEKPSIVKSISTSKPVKAIFNFNKVFVDLMVSSLGIVAGLSWNEYFKSMFQEGGRFYKTVGASGLLYVAMFATLLAYLATVLVTTLYPDRPIPVKDNPIKKSIDKE